MVKILLPREPSPSSYQISYQTKTKMVVQGDPGSVGINPLAAMKKPSGLDAFSPEGASEALAFVPSARGFILAARGCILRKL
jgi:hypothetical protein